VESITYVLDANVFIEAARRYYAFDLAPKFWETLVLHSDDRIHSIDRVYKDDLLRGNDEVTAWVQEHFAHAFASTDEADVIRSYGEVMDWVQGCAQFSDAAKTECAKSPDAWLVAYARAKGCVVVTHEVLAPDAKRKVPIPNICQQFNVRYIDTFTMLRELGVCFA